MLGIYLKCLFIKFIRNDKELYKYARNRYLGDSLNNFVCEESI